MASPELEKPTPEIIFAPVYEYDDRFQQLSVLEQMGYPVVSEIIRNNDQRLYDYFGQEKYRNDTTMQTEAPKHRLWAQFLVEQSFHKIIEDPDAPGSHFNLDDKDTQIYIEDHPIQFILGINALHFTLSAEYKKLKRSPQGYMRHHELGENYPWEELLKRFIVTSALEHEKGMCGCTTAFDWSCDEARELIDAGVRPLNGEQIGGIVSDYYHLIEKHFPEFKAFKRAEL